MRSDKTFEVAKILAVTMGRIFYMGVGIGGYRQSLQRQLLIVSVRGILASGVPTKLLSRPRGVARNGDRTALNMLWK